ncbi:alpha/beta hydrolase [Geodermatophilus sp. YIM 151500]|uniref:alpha/beta hydrolase n=1 Tax=Geodermatophilus sp. YIM 151500 TaxID=2984531 RepID=UPI0021E416BA|nr:alpha/beta hydrolase [Geodermatophilus sp. YIM 151500]MCV2489954.1 alpha/beta hydrolase [Geodermatophilus sp. YIM 151500]
MDDAARAAWGSVVDLGGPVHYVDYGGPDGGGAAPGAAPGREPDATRPPEDRAPGDRPLTARPPVDRAPSDGPDRPTVVLVHGLGGSHLNWDLLAPLLTPHARVLALDLPGFGFSEPGERRATVRANVAVLQRFLAEVAGGPVVLVGNSMGGMISILAAAGAPGSVDGLVLVDPAVPGPRTRPDPLVAATFAVYALPGLGERFMWWRRHRQTPLGRALSLLRLCGVDPDTLPPEVIDRSVLMLEQRQDVVGMDKAFLTAARSLLAVLAEKTRYYAAMGSLRVPVLLVQGDADRLVPVEAARDVARRHPHWRYVELAGVGHVPQLQVPQRLAEEILGWLPRPRGQARGRNVSRSASSPV